MDLSFGPRYEDFRSEVRQFIEENKSKSPQSSTSSSKQTRDWQALLIENGYAARTIPREYGGYGGVPDIVESRIIAEEFSKQQINTGLGGQGISMLVPVLLEMGTEGQKKQFIETFNFAQIYEQIDQNILKHKKNPICS